MKNSFSLFQWFRRVLTASVFGGGFALLMQEWTEYQMLGHLNLNTADVAPLRNALNAPNLNSETIVFIVGLLFGGYKALRNYARNHPDANDWLKNIFGDTTGVH
jgi:hypothetical protein